MIDKTSRKLEDILTEMANLENELYEQNIMRSSHLVGGLGEYYAKTFYNLIYADSKVEKGYDLLDANNLRYQVKCRRTFANPTRKQESKQLIQGLSNENYDIAIIVEIGRNYNLVNMFAISRKKAILCLRGKKQVTTIPELQKGADNPLTSWSK